VIGSEKRKHDQTKEHDSFNKGCERREHSKGGKISEVIESKKRKYDERKENDSGMEVPVARNNADQNKQDKNSDHGLRRNYSVTYRLREMCRILEEYKNQELVGEDGNLCSGLKLFSHEKLHMMEDNNVISVEDVSVPTGSKFKPVLRLFMIPSLYHLQIYTNLLDCLFSALRRFTVPYPNTGQCSEGIPILYRRNPSFQKGNPSFQQRNPRFEQSN
jgi:hypothetical protein